MRRIATTFLLAIFIAMPAFAQEEGDYRTHDSGDWSDAQIWQRYNGSAWVAIAEPPSGSETITITAVEAERTDSVFVDTDVTITGRLINQGVVEANDMLTIGDGGVYQHDRDAGKMPIAVWAEGSTLHMTGTETEAPEDRNQNYHNIIFETPGLLSNLNMDMDSVTVGGDITVLDTGLARWYLTTAPALEGSIITILGDVIVRDGTFSVQGTSNAETTFTVEHYGNVEVTGGNFSISRGSQGNGTTTWTLYEGDFHMENASSNSSTITPGGAHFVFAKEGTQTLTLENIDFSALPIEVASGTTLDMGASTLGGGGEFVLNEGGGIATTLPGGVAEIFALVEAGIILEENASFEFNGTEAQITSEMMPTVVENLTIDNPAGVTLSQETTINGVLDLQAGVFDNTIPFTLGADGSIAVNGGELLVDVATDDDATLPSTFYVEQNFPNPFNPATVIRFGLPTASDVTVRIYNTLGQEVRTLLRGHKSAGVHEVTFEADGLSSGLYLYRVEAGAHVVSKPMVLVE